MATETGPDLESAREAIEALMDDTCTIHRDSEGELDDDLDLITGVLARPVGQPVLVYDGRCKVSKSAVQMKYSEEAGRAVPVRAYTGGIPVDSPLPAEGDILTVTSSRRDPYLVDQGFRVTEVVTSTWAVQRKFGLELRAPLPVEDLAEILTEDGAEVLSETGVVLA